MSIQPPSLDNGYLWLGHTLAHSAQARQLEEELSANVRYQMNSRDVSELGFAYETEIEIWVHPDDYETAAAMLHWLVADL
jgi:hypothetical protein